MIVATVINFLTKISLENYARTQLGQKKSDIWTFTVSPGLASYISLKILLRKMEIYGSYKSGITLKWFENYLRNRKQYIQISNIKNT